MKNIVMLLDNSFAPDMRVYKEARALVEAGHRVLIFAWDRDCLLGGREVKDGIEIVRVRTRSRYGLGIRQLWSLLLFYLKVFPKLLSVKMDIIYCHDLLMLPMGIAVKILRFRKLIYDAHEIYWMMEEKKYSGFLLWLIRCCEWFCIKASDEFITVSEGRKKYYSRIYKKEIHVIGNYYDPIEINSEKKKNIRAALGIPEEKMLISYVGALHVERDLELLIDYAKDHPGMNALIAGKGYWEQYVKESAGKYKNVIFPGWVSRPLDYCAVSDIMYYMLKEDYQYNHYNASNNIYISIAAGVPIIANNIGEAGEIITKYGIGYAMDKRDEESFKRAVNYINGHKNEIEKNFYAAQEEYNWWKCRKKLESMFC